MPAIHAPIPAVAQQYADEAATLRNIRSRLVSAPHVRLHQLRRLDDRLVAHLDGLAVSGAYGSRLVEAALESPGRGQIFTATVRAIEDRNAVALDKLLAIVEAQPDSRRGLMSAFGWVSASSLRGITKALLESRSPFRRQVGLAACAMHHVDAGAALRSALEDSDVSLRACATHIVAELGQTVYLTACLEAIGDGDVRCACAAARAAAFLGDRGRSVAAIRSVAMAPGPGRPGSLGLMLKLDPPNAVRAVLQSLARDPKDRRLLIQCVAVVGDPHYMPWLIRQMRDPGVARLAGEAFSTMTGVDLSHSGMDNPQQKAIEAGPNDDPDDDDIAMDEDDNLPWPDPDKIEAWRQSNDHRFAPGTRYFMGAPPSPAHCLSILKTGFQRQRIAAAEHLSLMCAGTPLFQTAAPAWRQQRWLAAMGA